MKQLIDILDKENILFRLNSVNYKRVDSNVHCEINIEDSYKLSEVHEEMFSVALRRHVFCVPESQFDITVDFEIARWRDEKVSESLLDYDIESIINNDNIDVFTGFNFNRASAIISALTTNFGLNPLITPPVFLNDKDSE